VLEVSERLDELVIAIAIATSAVVAWCARCEARAESQDRS
jgi:hypothetical protein